MIMRDINFYIAVTWALMMLAILVTLVSVHTLLKYLRENQVNTWHRLGDPSIFVNNSLRNNYMVLKFLFRKEYLALSDCLLTRMATKVRVYYFISLSLLSALAMLFWVS